MDDYKKQYLKYKKNIFRLKIKLLGEKIKINQQIRFIINFQILNSLKFYLI